jgi:hypothetical protein
MRNDTHLIRNFLFQCMTQAEQALDGQDPGRMAEALRSILQSAYEVHGRRQRQPQAPLPRTTLAGAAPEAASEGR